MTNVTGRPTIWAPSRTMIVVELAVAVFAAMFGVLFLGRAQEGWERSVAFAFGMVSGFAFGLAAALGLFRRAVLPHMQSQHPGVEVPDRPRLGSRRSSVRR